MLPLTFALSLSSLVEEVHTRVNISNVTILKIYIFLVPSMCPNVSQSQERLDPRTVLARGAAYSMVWFAGWTWTGRPGHSVQRGDTARAPTAGSPDRSRADPTERVPKCFLPQNETHRFVIGATGNCRRKIGARRRPAWVMW